MDMHFYRKTVTREIGLLHLIASHKWAFVLLRLLDGKGFIHYLRGAQAQNPKVHKDAEVSIAEASC